MLDQDVVRFIHHVVFPNLFVVLAGPSEAVEVGGVAIDSVVDAVWLRHSVRVERSVASDGLVFGCADNKSEVAMVPPPLCVFYRGGHDGKLILKDAVGDDGWLAYDSVDGFCAHLCGDIVVRRLFYIVGRHGRLLWQ